MWGVDGSSWYIDSCWRNLWERGYMKKHLDSIHRYEAEHMYKQSFPHPKKQNISSAPCVVTLKHNSYAHHHAKASLSTTVWKECYFLDTLLSSGSSLCQGTTYNYVYMKEIEEGQETKHDRTIGELSSSKGSQGSHEQISSKKMLKGYSTPKLKCCH